MKTLKEFTSAAGESMTGNWLRAALCTFIFCLIFNVVFAIIYLPFSNATQSISSFYLISIIIMLPMFWGYIAMFLNVARGNSCKVGDLFHGYKDIGRIFGTMLLQTVYICLWSLLLLIPGIIKFYSYSLTPYILNDDPNLSYNAAIDKSMAMMKDHKKDLFSLDLSFIGYLLLPCFIGGCIIALFNHLPLRIGLIPLLCFILLYYIYSFFILPLWQTARAHFYLDLKAQQEQTSVEGI